MEVSSDNTFLYFGFGSNLLKERIQLQNPSAVFVDAAELKDYRLCFGGQSRGWMSDRWHGGVASVKPSLGDSVWGVVWRLKAEDLASLDDQEGEGIVYQRIKVAVKSSTGTVFTCWTYSMLNFVESVPSPQYLEIIRRGGEQNSLPADYQKWLAAIKDNGYSGEIEIMNNFIKQAVCKTFLYFAYGSNMLQKRIHINNPSAELLGPALLKGYRLCYYCAVGTTEEDYNYWRGAPATIEVEPGGEIWGVVWKLNLSDQAHLDSQEEGYRSLDVTVQTQDRTERVCRTYQILNKEPQESLPSPHYMKVIIEGAKQSGLPSSYVKYLEATKHNGDTDPPPIMKELL